MTERSDEAHAPTPTRDPAHTWYKQPEMIVGLSALMVSLVAVFVGVYSAHIDRSFARASVWPRLEIYRSYDNEPPSFSYHVRNSGTGPAIIDYASVRIDGKPIATWRELVDAVQHGGLPFVQSHIGSRTLTAGALTEIFTTDHEELARTLRLHDGKRVAIELCYCSVFDDCWRVDRHNAPERVKRCQVDDDARFRQ